MSVPAHVVEKATEKVRLIFRCKACERSGRGGVRRIEYREVRLHVAGTLRKHETRWLRVVDGRVVDYWDDLWCPTCRHRTMARVIEGSYNPQVKCSSQCQRAKGPVCDCECGGANHGAAWGI